MDDRRITDALRSMQPEVADRSTDDILGEVRTRARRRRRRSRIAAGVAGAAAAVVVVAGVAALDLGDDEGQRVVVDAPTTTSTTAPTTTSAPTTSTSAPAAPEVGTFADLADGVVGLELHSWQPADDPWWQGLWRADPELADEMASIVALGGDERLPEAFDLVTMRFELADGRIVAARVDLESGWVGPVAEGEMDLVAPGAQLPEDLTRRIRTEFNDAVGRPWEPVDLDHPNSLIGRAIDRMGLPVAELERVPAAMDEALDDDVVDGYPRWFVELLDHDDGPVLEMRERGVGDDSSRGADYRLRLVETPEGWQVGGAESRALCMRSTPGPAPHYGCL